MAPPARAGVAMPTFTAAQELFRTDGLTLTAGTSDNITANVLNRVTNQSGAVIDVSSVSNGLLVVNVTGLSVTTWSSSPPSAQNSKAPPIRPFTQ